DFFKIDAYLLRHSRFDGSLSPVLNRLVFRRHDAVAALLWHTDRKKLILVEQFRPAVYVSGKDGWTIELPAGLLDVKGETPVESMKRELIEETGYRVESLDELFTYHASVGGSTEQLTLFYGEVTDADHVANGGGEDEGEDISVVEWSTEQLVDGLKEGSLSDAKTIIAVQWLMANKL
ncbi:MAG TPA: NUDIX hydrolase, partial [Bacteroidetes bacterium]|nr:NUDIX hydrolase [Bacteroidota bacterium]HEX04242.1 NUDIX hydrolase [Bacteroidota bacterium]